MVKLLMLNVENFELLDVFFLKTYLPTHGNMASYANVNGKSRFKRTGASTIIFFTHIVRFEIKYSRETTLWRLMHQQNLGIWKKKQWNHFQTNGEFTRNIHRSCFGIDNFSMIGASPK